MLEPTSEESSRASGIVLRTVPAPMRLSAVESGQEVLSDEI